MLAQLRMFLIAVLCGVGVMPSGARAEAVPAPVQLVQQLTDSVMSAVRNDPALKAGDERKIEQLVQTRVLPFLDFNRMTASAVGRYWRQATPEQQQQLEEQFKLLLIHTYSGAIGKIKNQRVDYLPLRAPADATNVVVRTRVLDNG